MCAALASRDVCNPTSFFLSEANIDSLTLLLFNIFLKISATGLIINYLLFFVDSDEYMILYKRSGKVSNKSAIIECHQFFSYNKN
jgi:hypothetical protein